MESKSKTLKGKGSSQVETKCPHNLTQHHLKINSSVKFFTQYNKIILIRQSLILEWHQKRPDLSEGRVDFQLTITYKQQKSFKKERAVFYKTPKPTSQTELFKRTIKNEAEDWNQMCWQLNDFNESVNISST